MRLFLILSAFLLTIPWSVQAQVVPFEYTGLYANDVSEDGSFFSTGTLDPWIFGGRDGGPAEQFMVSSDTNISSLIVDATILATDQPQGPIPTPVLPTAMYYEVFSGTVPYRGSTNQFIPNINTLIATSGTLMVTPTDTTTTYDNLNVPFDVNLQPGTYWLAETEVPTGGMTEMETTQGYIDPPSVAPVPEPPTWILFVFAGILILVFNFKKLGGLSWGSI